MATSYFKNVKKDKVAICVCIRRRRKVYEEIKNLQHFNNLVLNKIQVVKFTQLTRDGDKFAEF